MMRSQEDRSCSENPLQTSRESQRSESSELSLDDLSFSYQPEKPSQGRQEWPPPEYGGGGSEQNAYNYYRPTELAPGWQKRLAIALTGLGVVIGGLMYLDHSQRKQSNSDPNSSPSASAPENPAAETPVMPEPAPIVVEGPTLPESGNLLHSSDQAVSLLEAKKLSPEVIEFAEAGSYTYLFEEAPSPAKHNSSQRGRGRSSAATNSSTSLPPRHFFLRGVTAEQRESAIHKIYGAGGVITATPFLQQDPASTQQEESGLSTGTVLTGIIAFALVAHLFMTIRASRQQKRMLEGQTGGMKALGKSGGEKIEQPDTTLDDIGGLGSQVEELREMVDDIRAVMNGAKHIDLPRGILLMGGPGTGKTLIARAIAGETGIPVITFDCSQFTALLKGTGPASVRDGFDIGRKERDALREKLRQSAQSAEEAAEKAGVCILFFDEFDSIGEEREGKEGVLGDDERKNTVNALLQEFDGVNELKNRNIIAIAATNFGANIDKALVRPGRFTKKIKIHPPRSPEQRLDILRKLARKEIDSKGYEFDDPSALQDLAQITPGQTGDDLKAVLRGARDLARRDGGRTVIRGDDIFESYQRHGFGRILDTPMSRDYLELVNWHEDGHALNAIGAGIDIFIRSAKPRGDSGGRVVMDPKGFGEILTSKEDMLKRIFIAAGGRAAEIERSGELGVTGGATSDFHQIRALIAQMLSDGMIEDHYALQPNAMRQEHLTEQQREICDSIFKSAITYARKGLQLVGRDVMERLVSDALGLDRELVGSEAMNFYRDRLQPEDIANLEATCQAFVNDYLGRNLALEDTKILDQVLDDEDLDDDDELRTELL